MTFRLTQIKQNIIDTFPFPSKDKRYYIIILECAITTGVSLSFSTLIKPLNKLMRKDEDFFWTEDCQFFFKTLKIK